VTIKIPCHCQDPTEPGVLHRVDGPCRSSEPSGIAQEQLWDLARKWRKYAEHEVDAGAEMAYSHCADDLASVLREVPPR
jgi:hypothetical protein